MSAVCGTGLRGTSRNPPRIASATTADFVGHHRYRVRLATPLRGDDALHRQRVVPALGELGGCDREHLDPDRRGRAAVPASAGEETSGALTRLRLTPPLHFVDAPYSI